MKKLFLLLLLVLSTTSLRAAYPAYEAFDTNDFVVVFPAIRINRSSLTNGSGISSNYFIVADSTNVVISTNVIGTNVTYGISVIDSGTFNPTSGYAPYNNAGSWADSSLSKSGGDWLLVSTNNVSIRSGSGYYTSIGDSDQWLVQGTVGHFVPSIPDTFKLGTASRRISEIYVRGHVWSDDGTALIEDSFGNGSPEGVVGSSVGSVYRDTNGTPGAVLYVKETGVTNENTGWVAIGGGGGGGDTNWNVVSSILQPIDLTLPLRLTNEIIWGTGNSNIMGHIGANVVITNGALSGTAGLIIATGDGTPALFTSGGNVAFVKGTLAVGLIDSLSGGNEIRWTENRLWPLSAHSIFGGDQSTSPSYPVGLINLQTNRIWGYMGASPTNFSYMDVYHTGTNGTVMFESKSSGIAGPPREFLFNNAVNIAGSGDSHFTNNVTIDGWTALGSSNQVKFASIDDSGGTTNITLNVNGTNYTFHAW